MKHKVHCIILFALCASCAVSGCVGSAEQQAAVSVTEPPEYISFNNENINIWDYASLISLFGQLSYENVIIENDADFIEAAERYDLEHLYDLYDFIDSLSDSEAGELHRIMLEAMNNI